MVDPLLLRIVGISPPTEQTMQDQFMALEIARIGMPVFCFEMAGTMALVYILLSIGDVIATNVIGRTGREITLDIVEDFYSVFINSFLGLLAVMCIINIFDDKYTHILNLEEQILFGVGCVYVTFIKGIYISKRFRPKISDLSSRLSLIWERRKTKHYVPWVVGTAQQGMIKSYTCSSTPHRCPDGVAASPDSSSWPTSF